MPRLKGLDFEIARDGMRLYEGRKMILNVKLLVRELTPYRGQEGSSRDRKESPFLRANELPSFPQGRILHGARLDRRRSVGEKMERSSAKGSKLCDRVCSDFSRIFHTRTVSPTLFTFSLMFSCLVQCLPYVKLFSRCPARLFHQLCKAIPSRIHGSLLEPFIIHFSKILLLLHKFE